MKKRTLQSEFRLALKSIIYNLHYGRKELHFANKENMAEYNFTLGKAKNHLPGISAMLRVKNEDKKILACLKSIKDVFDEIVIVNNGSTDRTKELVEHFMTSSGAAHIHLYDYPVRIAKCGKDNQATPENSVHSLAYYYNWCLSKCTRKWVFKWDGDMILPASRKKSAMAILNQIRNSGLSLWNIRGQTVYLDPQGMPWASLDEINHEEMCFPNNVLVHYKKENNWERLKSKYSLPEELPDEVFFYEIKDTREDEFSHWTSTSEMSPRKQTEYKHYQLVKTATNPGSRFTPIHRQDIYYPNQGNQA